MDGLDEFVESSRTSITRPDKIGLKGRTILSSADFNTLIFLKVPVG